MKKITPRLLVGCAVALAVGTFIIASPKTPLEFFDRAAQELNSPPTANDPQRAEILQRLSQLQRQQQRLELLYDLHHHPESVLRQRTDVLLGFYYAAPATQAALRNLPEMQQIFEETKNLTAALRQLPPPSPATKPPAKDPHQALAYLFRRTVLLYQARWFFPKP